MAELALHLFNVFGVRHSTQWGLRDYSAGEFCVISQITIMDDIRGIYIKHACCNCPAFVCEESIHFHSAKCSKFRSFQIVVITSGTGSPHLQHAPFWTLLLDIHLPQFPLLSGAEQSCMAVTTL